GSFEYTPDPGFVGAETISYTVSDGTATDQGTLTIDVVNEGPVVADETYSADDGETLTIGAAAGLLANDSDPDAADTIFVQSFTAADNGDLSVTTDGSFEYTPDPGFVGAETISYTVSDGTATDQGHPRSRLRGRRDDQLHRLRRHGDRPGHADHRGGRRDGTGVQHGHRHVWPGHAHRHGRG
ncbi:Ig-like domain-containing protein, partial [Roseovarius sp. D22-M7]